MPFTPAPPDKCKRCDKAVYAAEKQKDSMGGFWHKRCYTCRNCADNNKTTKLDSTTCCDNAGEIYCKACYGGLFGPKGYGYGGGAGALTRTQ